MNPNTLKTNFRYTMIPNMAQYKKANWKGHLPTKSGMTLDDAKSYAENDPSVSYFFHMKRSMALEQDNGPTRRFLPQDAAFFSGRHLWLGSAPGMADTYLIAETYDTSDTNTKEAILKQLTEGFLLEKFAKSSGGTKKDPKKITAGWIFVDFDNVRGKDIDIKTLREKLEGKTNNTNSYIQEFISRESNQRVELVLETYKTTGSDGDWVHLENDHTDYKNDFDKIFREIDKHIDFPNHWDIAMMVFPDGSYMSTSTTPYKPESGFFIDCSGCISEQLVDVDEDKNPNGQLLQFIFIDPANYDDSQGAHITSIHEIMHALGLPDMYNAEVGRSFGWSIMSAAGAGEHITQFEKLLLGWEDADNFIFLKRGMVAGDDIAPQNDSGKKGVIILPDSKAGRGDVYFIERAQPIGVGEQNRAAFEKNNGTDYGLLAMMQFKDNKYGAVVPFVSKRPADFISAREMYGGASEAPFREKEGFSTNGIFCIPTYKHSLADNRILNCIIGVNSVHKTSNMARYLRENEKISSDDATFFLNPLGGLTFGDDSIVFGADDLPVTYDLFDWDYGFIAYVDDYGAFHVKGYSDKENNSNIILKSFDSPKDLPQGKYFFKLEKIRGENLVNIYRKDEAEIVKVYTLFSDKGQLSRSWNKKDGDYIISFNPDGNLVIVDSENSEFLGGTIQTFGEENGAPDTITFNKEGEMEWWIKGKLEPIQKFPGKPGVGPFTLGVNKKEEDKYELIIKDSKESILSEIPLLM